MTNPQDSDSERIERIEGLVEKLVDDVEKIASEQAEMKAEQAEMKSGIARLTHDVDIMKGWQTELVVERRATSVFRQLCRGGHLLRIYPYGELQHYIGAVRHSGNMTEQEFDQAGSIDFVLEGTDREGAAVMYAVEVSFAIGVGDNDRAIGKAELLTKALGRQVRPAVAGESSTIEFEDDARQRGVAYAYIGNGRDIVR